jgi:hypothetical protein
MVSIEIVPGTQGDTNVILQPCPGFEVIMKMKPGTIVFEEPGRRGLEGGNTSLTIHEDGLLEYNGPEAEYSFRLPEAVGADLYAAFEGQKGKPVTDEILVDEEEEDPQAAGSRLNVQRRHTKRNRRNHKRRQLRKFATRRR